MLDADNASAGNATEVAVTLMAVFPSLPYESLDGPEPEKVEARAAVEYAYKSDIAARTQLARSNVVITAVGPEAAGTYIRSRFQGATTLDLRPFLGALSRDPPSSVFSHATLQPHLANCSLQLVPQAARPTGPAPDSTPPGPSPPPSPAPASPSPDPPSPAGVDLVPGPSSPKLGPSTGEGASVDGTGGAGGRIADGEEATFGGGDGGGPSPVLGNAVEASGLLGLVGEAPDQGRSGEREGQENVVMMVMVGAGVAAMCLGGFVAYSWRCRRASRFEEKVVPVDTKVRYLEQVVEVEVPEQPVVDGCKIYPSTGGEGGVGEVEDGLGAGDLGVSSGGRTFTEQLRADAEEISRMQKNVEQRYLSALI